MICKRGFSLIELMVVSGIISLLCGCLTVFYGGFCHRSRDVVLQREQFLIRRAIDGYARRYGRYPDEPEALVTSGFVHLSPVDGTRQARTEDVEIYRWKDRWTFVRNTDGEPRGIIDAVPVGGEAL